MPLFLRRIRLVEVALMGEKAEILRLERSPCSCQVEGLNWLQRHFLDEAMRQVRQVFYPTSGLDFIQPRQQKLASVQEAQRSGSK